ncbi:MSC_0623 family F1-like ATPase-associated protein [Metamycoplasma gateae]|uniref:DUF2714 domain-containing protein n=1 Tax=Metamycoplasma gateae TaxID=35769 RepID=A0ABZ2AL67_9BACT|nr:DUF2714 domain-containing protein [Metamycoplasma gateae]
MARKPIKLIEKNKEKILFWFDERKTGQEKIISFHKLISTVLFKNNFKKDDNEFKDFINLINSSLKNKEEIAFDKFSIKYEFVPKFSLDKKIPLIINQQNEIKNKFAIAFNKELKMLIDEQYYVEFLPNITLYNSLIAHELKIYINKEYFIDPEGEKNGK